MCVVRGMHVHESSRELLIMSSNQDTHNICLYLGHALAMSVTMACNAYILVSSPL